MEEGPVGLWVVHAGFAVSVWLWSSLNADSDCSTLVVKQKLPGVYVQPSYRSALSKFECNFLKLIYTCTFLNSFFHSSKFSHLQCGLV